jgi:hypothetical protein
MRRYTSEWGYQFFVLAKLARNDLLVLLVLSKDNVAVLVGALCKM